MWRLITKVWRRLDLAYHQLALSQIDPAHPEVPYITAKIKELRS